MIRVPVNLQPYISFDNGLVVHDLPEGLKKEFEDFKAEYDALSKEELTE